MLVRLTTLGGLVGRSRRQQPVNGSGTRHSGLMRSLRRQPELVFGLLIALELPKRNRTTILDRPNVNLRGRPFTTTPFRTLRT